MAVSREAQIRAEASTTSDYDAIIVGAGISGIYQLLQKYLHIMRESPNHWAHGGETNHQSGIAVSEAEGRR